MREEIKEKSKAWEVNFNFLDINISNCIKGIAAVSIMLGHYFADLSYPFTMFFAGNLWVAIFFFYSGYGLDYSRKNKQNYIKSFFAKKALSVYFPFLAAETAYTILSLVLNKENYSPVSFIFSCLGLKLGNGVLWYVVELIAIYLLFYIENKFFSKIKAQIIWYLAFALFLAIAVYKDIDTCWYISTFAFLLGYFFDDYKKLFILINKAKWRQTLTVLVFLIGYAVMKFFSITKASIFVLKATYIIVALDLVLAPLFICFVCVCCEMISKKYQSLKPFMVLSKVSYEIYLWHMVSFLLIGRFVSNVAVSIVLSIALSLLLSFINMKINVLVKRCKK